MSLFHIPQCTVQNRNVYIFVLNGALWDTEHVHCGIVRVVYSTFFLLAKRMECVTLVAIAWTTIRIPCHTIETLPLPRRPDRPVTKHTQFSRHWLHRRLSKWQLRCSRGSKFLQNDDNSVSAYIESSWVIFPYSCIESAMERNYLSIPKLQRYDRWSLEIDK